MKSNLTKNDLQNEISKLQKELNLFQAESDTIAKMEEPTEEQLNRVKDISKEMKDINLTIDEYNEQLVEKQNRSKALQKQIKDTIEENRTVMSEKATSKMVSDENYALEWAKALHSGTLKEFLMNKSMDTTSFGAVIPTTVVDGIQQKFVDRGGILAHSEIRQLIGTTKIAVETLSTGASNHLEGTPAPAEKQITLGEILIDPKMVKDFITWTDELEYSTPEGLLSYLTNKFAEKIAVKIEENILFGTTSTSGYTGIITESQNAGSLYVKKVETNTPSWEDAHVAMADLRGDDPVFFMNKKTYHKNIATQKTTTNEPIWQMVNGNPYFSTYPVQFTDSLPPFEDAGVGDTFMVLLAKNAYKIIAPRGITPEFTLDEITLAPEDKKRLVGKVYSGGAMAQIEGAVVINKKA